MQYVTRKVAEIRLWLLLLESWDKRWWSLTNQELPSLTQLIRIQYVLANEKVMNRHWWTTIWSPILASHHITSHHWRSDDNFLKQRESWWICLYNWWLQLQLKCTVCTVHSDLWRLWQHKETTQGNNNMNLITVFQIASWTIGLWDYWLVGIEAGAGPISAEYSGFFGIVRLP